MHCPDVKSLYVARSIVITDQAVSISWKLMTHVFSHFFCYKAFPNFWILNLKPSYFFVVQNIKLFGDCFKFLIPFSKIVINYFIIKTFLCFLGCWRNCKTNHEWMSQGNGFFMFCFVLGTVYMRILEIILLKLSWIPFLFAMKSFSVFSGINNWCWLA